MKKKILLFIIMMGLCFVGTSVVNAVETQRIVIFTSDQSTTKVNVETGEVVGSVTKNLAVGTTMTFEAKQCTINSDQADHTTNEVTVTKSACQDITASYFSTNENVLTIENNVGTVKGTGTTIIGTFVFGFPSAKLQVIISSDTNQGSNDSTNTDTNTNTNTNTDNVKWKYLYVVDKDTKTVYYDSKSGKSTSIKKTIYVGNKEQFFAYICSSDKATVSGTKATWNISDCEKAPKVTWEKDQVTGAAFSIDQNGVVTGLKSGFGFGFVIAKVDKADIGLKENEYYNPATNSVSVVVEDAKYNGNSNNGTTDDGKDVKIGDTASNTSIILVVTSVLMIGFGSYLIVTSRRGQKANKNN